MREEEQEQEEDGKEEREREEGEHIELEPGRGSNLLCEQPVCVSLSFLFLPSLSFSLPFFFMKGVQIRYFNLMADLMG